MMDILIILAKSVPVIIILLWEVRYFKKKENKYIATIEKLNRELRESEKETLTIMSRLTNTLDKVFEDNKEDKEEILKELKEINSLIQNRM